MNTIKFKVYDEIPIIESTFVSKMWMNAMVPTPNSKKHRKRTIDTKIIALWSKWLNIAIPASEMTIPN